MKDDFAQECASAKHGVCTCHAYRSTYFMFTTVSNIILALRYR